MAEFFQNPEDLGGWIKSKKSGDEAATELMGVIKTLYQNVNVAEEDEQSIFDSCKQVYTQENNNDNHAAEILFGVLSKHNITTLRKEAKVNMKNKTVTSKVVTATEIKEAQSPESRQRNGWVKGMRNKWNRVVDGFNEGTPWREDRDKMYNFTHYYTDAISFDEDPTHVYSGEAIWRMHIMDKFSSETQDKDGRWVGGYINDRYHVFPDAGTPANPEVDRMQGNQMELAAGERTRKPRPHQYSIERRMEEARGHKTTDLEATSASFNKLTKIASKLPVEREEDRIYKIITDVFDMREAGIDYEKRLEMLSEHYEASITGIAQIEKIASNLVEKHNGIGYELQKQAQSKRIEQPVTVELEGGGFKNLNQGDVVREIGKGTVMLPNGSIGTIKEDPTMPSVNNAQENANPEDQVNPEDEYLDAAFDVGGKKSDKTDKVQNANITQADETNFPISGM
jgi:hypothetical protein